MGGKVQKQKESPRGVPLANKGGGDESFNLHGVTGAGNSNGAHVVQKILDEKRGMGGGGGKADCDKGVPIHERKEGLEKGN